MSIKSGNDYKPDLEIMDRYINFSAELLRISLLAIGGFGTIMLIKLKNESNIIPLHHLLFLYISICCFVLCAGFALFHRFYASDSMSWYISYLRAKADNNKEKTQREQKGLHRTLRYSSVFLIFTEVMFGIAVVFFAIGIYQLIFV